MPGSGESPPSTAKDDE